MGKTKVWPLLLFGIIFLLLGGVLPTAQADHYDYDLETNSPTDGDQAIVVEFTNNSGEEIEVSGPVEIKVWSPREWAVEELDPVGDEVFSGPITMAHGDTVTIAKIATGLPDTWRPYEQMDGELEFDLFIKIDGVYWRSPTLVHIVEKVGTPNYGLVLTTNSPTGWEQAYESIILKLKNDTNDTVTVSGPAVVQPLGRFTGVDLERYDIIGGDTITIPAGETEDVVEIEPGSPVSWRALYFPQYVALQVWLQVDEGELGPRLWQSLTTYHVVEGTLPIFGLWRREGSVPKAADNMDGTATIGVKVNHHEWWNEFSVDTQYEQSDPRYVVDLSGGMEREPATSLTRDQFFVERYLEGGGMEPAGGTLLSVRETAPGDYELCWSHEEGTHDIVLTASVPGSEEVWVLFETPPPLAVTISAPPKKVDAELNPDTGQYEAQLSWSNVNLDISSAQEVDATISVQRKGDSSNPPGPGLTPAGIYMEINVTEGSLEGAEVLIEVAYSLEDLPSGMKESDLRLFRFNESRGEWELCGATEDERGVDTDRKVIWAIVPGFSEFAVFEYSPDAKAGAEAGAEAGVEADVEAGAEEDEEAMVDLPATAGTLPLLPVAGLALATAGLAVLRRKRHR